jgi:hypothetical protein
MLQASWRAATSALVVAIVFSVGTLCWAYDPPVDQVGPLTVRIDGPNVITETGKPVDYQLRIQNAGDTRVSGALRLGVIDRWGIADGRDEAEFTVDGKGQTMHPFVVVPGKPSYHAHYPIHAHVRFEHAGREHHAHPIHIVETRPSDERSLSEPIVPWRALRIRENTALSLVEAHAHRTLTQVFGEETEASVVGRHRTHPVHAGNSSVQSIDVAGVKRDTLVMHPPWKDGNAGTIAKEFPLRLPATKPIRLAFTNSITSTGHGDGVTFRVRVAPGNQQKVEWGEVVHERHLKRATWAPADVDLSRFAGQEVRLQLESHPGPQKNTGWDLSYWANPVLICGRLPPPHSAPLEVGRIRCGDDIFAVRISPGRRGLLDAIVGMHGTRDSIRFDAFVVKTMGCRVDHHASSTTMLAVEQVELPNGKRFIHKMKHPPHGEFEIVADAVIDRDALRFRFQLRNGPASEPWFAPRLEDLAIGRWSKRIERVFAGHGNVLVRPRSFELPFDGHRLSTSFVGLEFESGMSLLLSSDLPPHRLAIAPDAKRASLHTSDNATLSLIPADSVWQAARKYRDTNGLKSAAGVERLAGRFVFDLWGGRYQESHQELTRAFKYGLTNSAVVWHNWQRWGYDYRLPDILPPNPHWGTSEQLHAMIADCKRRDVLFALHDNYIDMYPDAEGFSYETNIAFGSTGQPIKAWLNKHREARSYRYRCDRIEPFLRRNVDRVNAELSPNAYFIDVWSSIRPYDYFTENGQYYSREYSRDTWARHFNWIRDLQGGDAPQISESGHDQLIGSLDGAQTNHLRVGPPLPCRHSWATWNIECEDAERIPWFDAAHHDRFVLHGAGYPGRYQAGLDAKMHGIYSDDYIGTEVLTGHPAMAPEPFSRNVVRKYWLLDPLMRSLKLKRIEDVRFERGDIHRQHVRWSNGDVWVNRSDADWHVEERILPPFGFFARVESGTGRVTASIERREGVIVETAVSPEHLYVNGRRIADGPWPIAPTARLVSKPGDEPLKMAVRWKVDRPIPADHRPFIHFVNEEGGILFQGACSWRELLDGGTGTIETSVVVPIPEDLDVASRNGKCRMCAGIYAPKTGRRLEIKGVHDGQQRVILGDLFLAKDDKSHVRFEPQPNVDDPFIARRNVNARPISFGAVTTAGGYRLSRDGNQLTILPLPRQIADDGQDVLTINWSELPWQLPTPTHIESIMADGSLGKKEAVSFDAGAVSVRSDGKAFAYRLTRSVAE